MTLHRCTTHDIPTPNATLCPKCLWDVEQDLGDIPALTEQLDITLSRQDRITAIGLTETEDTTCTPCDGTGRTPAGRCPTCNGTGRLPVTARIQRLGFNPATSTVASDLHDTLVAWARDIHTTTRDHPPAQDTPALSRWLLNHLEHIRTHPAGDTIRDEINYAVTQARYAIDRPAERLYAGPCLEPTDTNAKCAGELYAKPGADTVTCPTCNAQHDLQQRRTWLLAAAEDHLATATHIAQAVTSLGAPVTADRIRKWAERGRVTAHSVDYHGHPLYRVGDVIDLLAADSERAARRSA